MLVRALARAGKRERTEQRKKSCEISVSEQFLLGNELEPSAQIRYGTTCIRIRFDGSTNATAGGTSAPLKVSIKPMHRPHRFASDGENSTSKVTVSESHCSFVATSPASGAFGTFHSHWFSRNFLFLLFFPKTDASVSLETSAPC